MKAPLPIDHFIPQILEKLREVQNLVLVAEPGAGKTTRLPPALLSLGQKEVLVLEPRRVAAVVAADRVASENGWQIGCEVGYRVRFDSKTSSETRLIFMTEAILARRLLSDSEFKNVDVVVLDEFHERSLHVDLALGLLREMQELGHGFKIVVMSATLEAEKIALYLGDAPIVRVPGKLFPLDIRFYDKPLKPLPEPTFYSALVSRIKEAAQGPGDVLVFLPGVAEIARTRERLIGWAQVSGFELVDLHGSLQLEDQRRALRPSSRKKIILSTNVAESSLTVDGVTAVVDSGFAKVMRQDLATGFQRLELVRISAASAKQRAGRAARQAPGVCFKMWGKSEELSLKKDEVAEILRSDLSESLLFLAATGVTNPAKFSWFEAPSHVALDKALRDLRSLGAISDQNEITEHGRRMVQLPLEPLWANFLILCAQHGELESGALIAALMQERDIVRPGYSTERFEGSDLENDVLMRLQMLNSSHKNIFLASERLKELVRDIPAREKLSLDEIVLKAFASRLCRRRQPRSEKALMVGGRGVRLSPESIVKKSEFFIAFRAVELSGAADTTIGLAYGLDSKTVFKVLSSEIKEENELYFDEEKGQFFNRRAQSFRGLILEEPRLSPADATQSEEQLVDFLSRNLSYLLNRNSHFSHWYDRWQAFKLHFNLDYDLTQQLKESLQMAAIGEKKLEAIAAKNIVPYLESLLPPDLVSEFNKSSPAYFVAPTGSKFKIHYPSGCQPYVEVRLQELFGTRENPKLFGEKVPLQFHLLGPNYRPQQVTSDILSFWQNTYPEVRKEMRIRYPKHSWPEDPLNAPPVKKGQSVKKP